LSEIDRKADDAGTGWRTAKLDAIPGVLCPCGTSRRAFQDNDDAPASIHRVETTADARVHYHKRLTEMYYILECAPDAALELDGETVPVSRGACFLLPPLVRHRALGRMTILNFVVPRFDPDDEWFD